MQTKFEPTDCDPKRNNISCYSEPNPDVNLFINYTSMKLSRCASLLSAVSVDALNEAAISVEVQVLEVGWWLEGNCRHHCSKEANCTELVSPVTHQQAVRCRCKDGFSGDGFRAGSGCTKVSRGCNPSRLMSGRCGGTTRISIIVGGVVAGISSIISLSLVYCFLRRRYTARKNSTRRGLSASPLISAIPFYSYKAIERATNSFSEKQRLGTGAYGTVYSGKLYDHDLVAIKRIKSRDADSIEQVINEIKIISSVSHPNLLRLLGCSIENEEQILIYEFMPNGTLSQHLQRERGNGLPWPTRITIATQTAQAIAYLHSAINPPIYHRDVKSSNILLDHNFSAKVADFGLSRLGMTETSHISTAPQGTPGYLDPQYHQDYHVSDKSDVYSFGVVLMEIITGSKAVDFSRPQYEVNLAALAIDRIGKGCLDEIIDPFIEPNRDDWTLSSIHKVAELAFGCLSFHRDMRPSMKEVANELEQIRLSKLSSREESNICEATSSYGKSTSSSSSSSNESQKPLSSRVKKENMNNGLLDVEAQDDSSISVHDLWLSRKSSPSSNSLLTSD